MLVFSWSSWVAKWKRQRILFRGIVFQLSSDGFKCILEDNISCSLVGSEFCVLKGFQTFSCPLKWGVRGAFFGARGVHWEYMIVQRFRMFANHGCNFVVLKHEISEVSKNAADLSRVNY